jgi:hypothetical protein
MGLHVAGGPRQLDVTGIGVRTAWDVAGRASRPPSALTGR